MTERAFRPCDRDQMLLLPLSLREWLPDDHLVYFIADLVEETLDLSEIMEFPAVSIARIEEGQRRVGPCVYDAQHFEAIEKRAV